VYYDIPFGQPMKWPGKWDNSTCILKSLAVLIWFIDYFKTPAMSMSSLFSS